MSFYQIWLQALAVIIILMTVLLIIGVTIKNVNIVDLFWRVVLVISDGFYYLKTSGNE